MSRSEKRRLTAWVRRHWARMDDATRLEVADAVSTWATAETRLRERVEGLPTNWAGWSMGTPLDIAAYPLVAARAERARRRLLVLKERVCVPPAMPVVRSW
jgi:hypothetical protein